MNPKIILLLCSVLAFAGCSTTGGGDLTVGLSSPAATAYTGGTLNVQATVSGGTPDTLELLRDGNPLTNLSAPYAYAWDTRALAEGGYSLGIRATKGGKTILGEARTVFVDRTAPTVSLSSNTVSLTTAGSLNLNADVNDSRGIALVEFLDGGQKVGEATSSPYTVSLNLSSTDNREHNYTAKATDRAGNSSTSTPIKVNVLIPKRTSENLIVNGDAEAGPASPSAGYLTDLPGWPSPAGTALRFTVVRYGVSGFPNSTEAPPNAGNNFFTGGPDVSPQPSSSPNIPDSTVNSAFQSITLPTDWNAAIDAGSVTFDLSGYFGSIGNLNDTGTLSASFYDAGGQFLQTTTFKGVSALERGGKTGFVQRATTDPLPRLTRSVRVTLSLFRTTGRYQYNAGLADNLSLVLKAY